MPDFKVNVLCGAGATNSRAPSAPACYILAGIFPNSGYLQWGYKALLVGLCRVWGLGLGGSQK